MAAINPADIIATLEALTEQEQERLVKAIIPLIEKLEKELEIRKCEKERRKTAFCHPYYLMTK